MGSTNDGRVPEDGMSDPVKSSEAADTAAQPAERKATTRADDYDWGSSRLSDRWPAPPPQPSGMPGWAIAVLLAVGLSLVLWFPVGLKALRMLDTNPAVSGDAEPWIQGRASSAIALRIAPAVRKVANCVEAKDVRCACDVALPASAGLAEQAAEHAGDGGGSRAAQAALRDLLTEYGYLRVVVTGACPGGSLDAISQAVDRYAAAHNRFVDAVNAGK